MIALPSGSIDLAFDGTDVRVQFNCSCEDALPYCHAQCCRGRPEWNVPVTDADWVWEDMPLPTAETLDGKVVRVLPVIDNHCGFLDEQSRCMTYDARPEACRNWHCSPDGVGEGITTRGLGWKLTR